MSERFDTAGGADSPGATAVPASGAVPRTRRTHRFEPARFLLGVALLVVAPAYLLDAFGPWQIPTWLLLTMVPMALLLGGCTALVTSAVRRATDRRRAAGRPRDADGWDADGWDAGGWDASGRDETGWDGGWRDAR